MQLGVDLSTSHDANSFIGTGLTDAFDPAEDHIVDWGPVDDGLGPDNPTAPPCSAIFSLDDGVGGASDRGGTTRSVSSNRATNCERLILELLAI